MAPFPDPLNAFLDYPQTSVNHAVSGPLAGLRLAVKDIYDVAGYPTGCGNPDRLAESSIAAETAPAIKPILEAGAQFIGKTQTDELAFSLMGQNAHYPQPINTAAPARVTGGSSSGSAAAVAGGLADIAVGSDTGGSIRAPASFCGLIGLRTTHGLVSMQGVMPLAPSLDTFGFFARDAGTYEKVAEVVLPPLPSPLWEKGKPSVFRLPALETLLLGRAETIEYARMASIVIPALGTPAPMPPPTSSIDDLYWCFRRIQAYEAWQNHGAWISATNRHFGAGIEDRFRFGATIDDDTLRADRMQRDVFRVELADALGQDGILVLPTVPGAAPLKQSSQDALQAYRERALRLLCWSGLSGFPQITLPLGAVDGAPFGISLLGPPGSDRSLVRLARKILEAAGKG